MTVLIAGTRVVVGLPAKRRPYKVSLNSLDEIYVWGCPLGCGFRVADRDRDVVQAGADAHRCEAGWCPIPRPV